MKSSEMRKVEVNTPWIPDRSELYGMLDDVLDRRALTNNSKYVKQLELELAGKTAVPFVYTVTNGTMALHVALRSLQLEPGEIITTPFSFIATSSSILWEGFKPVFVDVRPQDLCIDADSIEARINSRTRAIMAVHVFGSACDIDKIDALGRKYEIPVIYDGAHAFGIQYRGKSIFHYGTVSTLSMHASKILTSIEGGALFCSDDDLAERIFKVRYFGKDRENREEILGTNAKMNEFNAVYGLLSLRHFDEEVAGRSRIAQQYDQALADNDFFQLLYSDFSDNRNYCYYPVILPSEEDVDRAITAGRRNDIIVRRYWHPALTNVAYLEADPTETPVAVRSANQIICLPIYSDMTRTDTERVLNYLKNLPG